MCPVTPPSIPAKADSLALTVRKPDPPDPFAKPDPKKGESIFSNVEWYLNQRTKPHTRGIMDDAVPTEDEIVHKFRTGVISRHEYQIAMIVIRLAKLARIQQVLIHFVNMADYNLNYIDQKQVWRGINILTRKSMDLLI
jgi:hypothetical protein